MDELLFSQVVSSPMMHYEKPFWNVAITRRVACWVFGNRLFPVATSAKRHFRLGVCEHITLELTDYAVLAKFIDQFHV